MSRAAGAIAMVSVLSIVLDVQPEANATAATMIALAVKWI